MAEQVLMESRREVRPEGVSPETLDFTGLHRVISRLAEGEDVEGLDPRTREALKALVGRLCRVWDRKGSFLKVGMSPFLQNLLIKAGSGSISA